MDSPSSRFASNVGHGNFFCDHSPYYGPAPKVWGWAPAILPKSQGKVSTLDYILENIPQNNGVFFE